MDNEETFIKQTSQDNWCVYCHIAPNGMRYVGITSKAPASRWKHDGEGYAQQPVFYKAIVQFGWDSFTHELLVLGQGEPTWVPFRKDLSFEATNPWDEATAKGYEKFFIERFRSFAGLANSSGYNMTLGGDGTPGLALMDDYERKTKDLRFDSTLYQATYAGEAINPEAPGISFYACIDICNDLLAGLLLNQLLYLSDEEQSSICIRVNRENSKWIVKTRDGWFDEIRISSKQYDRAVKLLKAKGFVETRIWKFVGNPTAHIRVIDEAVNPALEKWLRAQYESVPTLESE